VPEALARDSMIFTETDIHGVWVVEPERYEDERGFFARTWDPDDFAAHGLNPHLAQCSISFNARRGTLRGLHFQVAPHEEAKLVRCTAGAMFDVALDLRTHSPTFGSWFGTTLSAENRRALYVPEGCAHGFLTLADATEVQYQISAPHTPDSARGVRWDDPAFGIEWPCEVDVISERDRTYADFETVHGKPSGGV
jgi:dTDP-4-dehydrorhamnose 3,5-epimerase